LKNFVKQAFSVIWKCNRKFISKHFIYNGSILKAIMGGFLICSAEASCSEKYTTEISHDNNNNIPKAEMLNLA